MGDKYIVKKGKLNIGIKLLIRKGIAYHIKFPNLEYIDIEIFFIFLKFLEKNLNLIN